MTAFKCAPIAPSAGFNMNIGLFRLLRHGHERAIIFQMCQKTFVGLDCWGFRDGLVSKTNFLYSEGILCNPSLKGLYRAIQSDGMSHDDITERFHVTAWADAMSMILSGFTLNAIFPNRCPPISQCRPHISQIPVGKISQAQVV